MKPIEIKTESDLTLTVQTVTPYIKDGNIRRMCQREFCMLVTIGEDFVVANDTDDGITYEIPILLNINGATQLIKYLELYVSQLTVQSKNQQSALIDEQIDREAVQKILDREFNNQNINKQ